MATSKATDSYDRDVRRAREAKALYGDELLSIPGVHGVGIGYKRKGNRRTKEIALVVHVQRKRPLDAIDVAQRVPRAFTFHSRGAAGHRGPDRRPGGRAPAEEVRCATCDTDFGDRVRPIPGGFSVGLSSQPGGTLGGWVWDSVNDQTVLISNHHVLGGSAGSTVIQPSIGDGGSAPADTIGAVVRAGTFDASIARVFDGRDVRSEIRCSTDAVFEVADATIGMEIEKVGQTTGLTCALVELIDYDSGHYGSHADLWIDGDGSNFSEGGDSGSLYVERSHPEGRSWKRVVGIHWGGSGDDGVGHPIRAVFQDLQVTTVCAGLFEALLEAVFGGRSEERDEREGTDLEPRRDTRRSGLARDLEERFMATPLGASVAALISEQRAALVRVLMTGDGRRAAVALLRPFVEQAVTTDDVLERPLDDEDLDNVRRLLKVVRRTAPELEPVVAFGEVVLEGARGVTVGQLLERDLPRPARKRPPRAKT